jgi:transcriptional regulator with XRE-family HTH domain
MSIPHKAIGKLLIDARRKKNLNQGTVANRFGFSAQFLGKVEKGAVPFPYTKVNQAKMLLGIPLAAFKKAYLRDFQEKINSTLK